KAVPGGPRLLRLGERRAAMRSADRCQRLARKANGIEVAAEDGGRGVGAQRQWRQKRLGLPEADDRAGVVPEVGGVGTTLDATDLEIRAAQLELQARIACGIGGPPREILQPFGDDRLTDRR